MNIHPSDDYSDFRSKSYALAQAVSRSGLDDDYIYRHQSDVAAIGGTIGRDLDYAQLTTVANTRFEGLIYTSIGKKSWHRITNY